MKRLCLKGSDGWLEYFDREDLHTEYINNGSVRNSSESNTIYSDHRGLLCVKGEKSAFTVLRQWTINVECVMQCFKKSDWQSRTVWEPLRQTVIIFLNVSLSNHNIHPLWTDEPY